MSSTADVSCSCDVAVRLVTMLVARHVYLYSAVLLVMCGRPSRSAQEPNALKIGLLLPKGGSYGKEKYEIVCDAAKNEMKSKHQLLTKTAIKYASIDTESL